MYSKILIGLIHPWLFGDDLLILLVLELCHVGDVLHVLQLRGALSAAEVEAAAATAAAAAAAAGEAEDAEHEALHPRRGELHYGAHHLVAHLARHPTIELYAKIQGDHHSGQGLGFVDFIVVVPHS